MASFEDVLFSFSRWLAGILVGFESLVTRTPRIKDSEEADGDSEPPTPDAEHAKLERLNLLLLATLQDAEIAMQVGFYAGIPAVFYYGASGCESGRAMRQILPRMYASAVPLIYVCGGASIFRGVLDSVSRYNIERGTWEAIPPMPTARRLCAAAVLGGMLYVLGGEQEGFEAIPLWYSELVARRYHQLSVAECFDPFKGSWERLPNMPTARAGCAAAAQGGMLYVMGGRIQETIHDVVERFDPAVRRWERLPSMPSARSGGAAVTLFGMIYVLGGKVPSGHILPVVERFDPTCGWWQNVPAMQTPRSAFSAATMCGKIFAAGGFNGVEGIDTIESFDPDTGIWEAVVRLSAWRIGATAVVAAGRLFILGGKSGHEAELLCESLDPLIPLWTALPQMPERHVYCAGGALVGCA
mmetsp:Transcript_38032/g.88944  ORF Transcript_38032/g.88944 Transcript_38032/m.88944 type:complete len:413 (-) Transcript_38032:69-1307(-)|eukprot:CAMPEP_0178377808 /NCGR_PEP_ID=MMETSP0689_2-20121128/4106_1 /TAXON_ID=160604 /ORGANISM="Amphidinium massartii, Strain CS-259" /LENGTH=412 /DNA_ID=CAMNT_0019997867 /DNA_START=78 /DNA_END=1316 /DNA_ORIENTATION=+